MLQQTTSLLRAIWDAPLWRDHVLTTFENWVREGASRNDVKGKLKAMIEAHLIEQNDRSTLHIELEKVNWDQLTEFLCACSYRKRF